MDDLKNIVIQNLEQEGTLGSLRAQLRAQVFKAIENYADTNTKQSAGFQWQNPVAGKIHDDPDSKIVALLIREYLEHYKMDYTLSVYLPEVAMQGQQHHISRDELAEKANIKSNADKEMGEQPLLVQLLQNMRLKEQEAGSAKKAGGKNTESLAANEEKKEQPKSSKSPFRSSADQQNLGSSPQTKDGAKATTPDEDDIEEDIVQDHEDIQLQPNSARDAVGTSGGAASSSAVGIDQSIDTLNLNEFDYVEEVKPKEWVAVDSHFGGQIWMLMESN